MTIDQLIAELHKRREALVQKGYPLAAVHAEAKVGAYGIEWRGFVWCGPGDLPFAGLYPDADAPETVLAAIDAKIADIEPEYPPNATDPWFDMAQLTERAAS